MDAFSTTPPPDDTPQSVFAAVWAQFTDPQALDPAAIDLADCFDLLSVLEGRLRLPQLHLLSPDARRSFSALDDADPTRRLTSNEFLDLYRRFNMSDLFDEIAKALPHQPPPPQKTPFRSKWPTLANKRSVSLSTPNLPLPRRTNDGFDSSDEEDFEDDGFSANQLESVFNTHAFTQPINNLPSPAKQPPASRTLKEKRSVKDIRTIDQQDKHISYVEDQNAALSTEIVQLKAALARLEKDNRRLKDSEDTHRKQIGELESHMNRTADELHERRTQYSSLSKKYNQIQREVKLKDLLHENNVNSSSKPGSSSSAVSFTSSGLPPIPKLEVPRNSLDFLRDLKAASANYHQDYQAFVSKLAVDTDTQTHLDKASQSLSRLFIAIVSNFHQELDNLKVVLNDTKEELRQCQDMYMDAIAAVNEQTGGAIGGSGGIDINTTTLGNELLFREFKESSAKSLASNTDENGNIDLDSFLEAIQRISEEQKYYLRNVKSKLSLLSLQDAAANGSSRAVAENVETATVTTERPRSKSMPTTVRGQMLRLSNKIKAAQREQEPARSLDIWGHPVLAVITVLIVVLSLTGVFSHPSGWLKGDGDLAAPGAELRGPEDAGEGLMWWQRFGSRVEVWGSELDRKARVAGLKMPV